MRVTKVLFLIFFVSFTVACTTVSQQAVQFSPTVVGDGASITVAMTEVPEPVMAYPGAGCLLCLGVAASANSSLSKHTKTLPIEDLEKMGAEVRDALVAKGLQANLVDEPFDFKALKKSSSKEENAAKKDFSVLREEFETTHVLVIKLDSVGIWRNYANYVPTSAPYANITGMAYLVNLETNTYEWYLPIAQQDFSEGEWKQKPDYPSLTNVYFGAIERVRESILSSLK